VYEKVDLTKNAQNWKQITYGEPEYKSQQWLQCVEIDLVALHSEHIKPGHGQDHHQVDCDILQEVHSIPYAAL